MGGGTMGRKGNGRRRGLGFGVVLGCGGCGIVGCGGCGVGRGVVRSVGIDVGGEGIVLLAVPVRVRMEGRLAGYESSVAVMVDHTTHALWIFALVCS